MTRDMLLNLLCGEHGLAYDEDAAIFRCDCDKPFNDYREWAEHVTDLILPGFAT